MISLFGAFVKPFQFTPLREGRRPDPGGRAATTPFQFTPLREGRHARLFWSRRGGTFQFTPLREGRRGGNAAAARNCPISIHAPPRGATDALAAWLGG